MKSTILPFFCLSCLLDYSVVHVEHLKFKIIVTRVSRRVENEQQYKTQGKTLVAEWFRKSH